MVFDVIFYLRDCLDHNDGGADDDEEREEEATGEQEKVVTSVRGECPRGGTARNNFVLVNVAKHWIFRIS